jgi:toxin ParE1/3/4
MSGRSLQVTLSARASRDVRIIQRHTLKQWGQEQATFYDEAILRALETLREHPELGKIRDELGIGFRSYRVMRHSIFYRVIDDQILVHRILHQRMEVGPDAMS